MSVEERQKLFVEEYNALVQKYGLVFEPGINAEQLGTAILSKPVLNLALVNNWQPSVPKDDGSGQQKPEDVASNLIDGGDPIPRDLMMESNGASAH